MTALTLPVNSFPHLIIVGGGFAGIELVKHLSGKPVRVTLLDRNNYHTFQPLLYQVASGGLGPDAIAYPLRKLIGPMPNIVFRMAEVQRVDTVTGEVITDIGSFAFDFLCLANGAQTNFFGNKELERNCLTLKSIPEALDLRSQILQEFEKAINKQQADGEIPELNFVVVGGGPTGVETAGALAEIRKNVLPSDYRELKANAMKVHLIEAAPRLLSAMQVASSRAAFRSLQKLGVDVRLNTSVQQYDRDSGMLTLSTGQVIQTNTVIWSAGVKGNILEGFPSEIIGRGNRYRVNAFNQMEGLPKTFVIGDLALMHEDPAYPNGHPMVAPVAIQQAHLFAKNLMRLIEGKPMKAFSYFDKGSMATVGRHRAVFESFGIRLHGFLAWWGWMFLHLMLLVGYRNRLIVFVNWMWNYFTYQRAIRIIVRKYVPRPE